MENKIKFLGIDIGGAHLKLVGTNIKKKIIFVSYLKCPIWEDVNNLRSHLARLSAKIDTNYVLCCITMTAELCDCFENRNYGVRKIFAICKESGLNFFFFSNNFSTPSKKLCTNSVSSMNWLAPAIFLKGKVKNAILIDFGSTTTDITIIQNHHLSNLGYTDFDRLKNSELVYTGIVRTPIFSLSNSLLIEGIRLRIIPEQFSNMADIYRISDSLPKNVDLFSTMDKKDKSKISSLKRVSRNFGFDYTKSKKELLKLISKKLIDIQLDLIFSSVENQLKLKGISKKPPIIALGIGKDLIASHCKVNNYKTECFKKFLSGSKKLLTKAVYHAPAAACAFLLNEQNFS